MSVFEDLIEELKEENLLEETVIETNAFARVSSEPSEPAQLPRTENVGGFADFPARNDSVIPAPAEEPQQFASMDNNFAADPMAAFDEPFEVAAAVSEFGHETFGIDGSVPMPVPMMTEIEEATVFSDVQADVDPSVASPIVTDSFPDISLADDLSFDVDPPDVGNPAVIPSIQPSPALPDNLAPPVGRTSFSMPAQTSAGKTSSRGIVNHKEYFRKRAIDEVAGLQMVDHVLSGVEREQMKLIPKPFDDIPVKKALHDFIQVSGNAQSADHARAEFQLMQETESWYSSLSHRDRHVSVAHLRRYCETTKPALSPQALIALGRFYRNSPFSEQVRNKFDLVLTRLFSVEDEDEKRELIFPREELIAQTKDLYADWSSIQVYTVAEDDSDVLIAVLKFQDFVTEAENTESFDELIRNDFFNRLRLFKESLHENFFAPLITIASIEANVKIGNRYIDLIKKERASANAAVLEEKYGFLHDQAISDSTGKSFYLVELLKERLPEGAMAELVEVRVNAEQKTVLRKFKPPKNRLWGVNKWLLGFTILTVIACGGIWSWAEYKSQELAGTQSPKVKKVNLENSSLKSFIQSARINEETFYGVTLNTWTDLTLEKKEELLKKIMLIGPEKGFKRVHLLNEKGRAVGFANGEKVDVFNP